MELKSTIKMKIESTNLNIVLQIGVNSNFTHKKTHKIVDHFGYKKNYREL